jgi:hypothetical protein
VANLLVAVGDVRIIRGSIILDQVRAGCRLYEGDLVETGADGYTEVACIDGSTFHVRANSSLSVEALEFADSSSKSSLVRITRGVVGFLAGRMARDGRLAVETPSATVRVLPSALVTSGLATLLLLFIIDSARAASEEILVLDSDDVTFKDLHYGTFEIVTKGQNPQVIVVDDPGQSVVLRPRGSGFSVELVANSLGQCAICKLPIRMRMIFMRGASWIRFFSCFSVRQVSWAREIISIRTIQDTQKNLQRSSITDFNPKLCAHPMSINRST